MFRNYPPLLLCSVLIVKGCSSDQGAARSVQEFLDSPIFLEAAVVRCSQNRTESRYDTECVNARQAVSIIEAREERARRDQLEAESESKRDALRRTQAAAAEARRRVAEAEQLQKEAEYLAQFGVTPPPATQSDEPLKANMPGAMIPAANSPGPSTASQPLDDTPPVVFEEPVRAEVESVPASDGGNAPVMQNDTATDGAQPNLDAVREELRRRQQDGTE